MHVDKYANGPDRNDISDLTKGDVPPHSRPLLLQTAADTVIIHKMEHLTPKRAAVILQTIITL